METFNELTLLDGYGQFTEEGMVMKSDGTGM